LFNDTNTIGCISLYRKDSDKAKLKYLSFMPYPFEDITDFQGQVLSLWWEKKATEVIFDELEAMKP
jgi:hypothetical protein